MSSSSGDEGELSTTRHLFRRDDGSSDLEPEEAVARRRREDKAAAAETKRRPRFLGDGASDDEDDMGSMTVFGGGGGGGKRPAERRSEIDALFDDLDDIEMPAPLALDTSIVPTVVADPLALDPTAAFELGADDDNVLGGGAAGAAKKKRKIVKLDEDRLMSQDGIPRLMQLTKAFKMKGKGHEMEDLKRLLKMYQLWAHQMYPKTNFEETVDTIETVCRKRRMQIALREWREEAKTGKKARLDLDEADAEAEAEKSVALEAALDASEPDDLDPPTAAAAATRSEAFDDEAMFDEIDFGDFDDADFTPFGGGGGGGAKKAAAAATPAPLFRPGVEQEAELDPFEEDEEAERAMREMELAEARERQEAEAALMPKAPEPGAEAVATTVADQNLMATAAQEEIDDEDLYA